MDLKDFVKTAIVSVIDAVAEAQQAVAAKGAQVNPADRSLTAGDGRTLVVDADDHATALIEEIEFDVAVTTGSQSDLEGGAGIKVWSIDFGMKSKGSSTDQQVSRIRFRVPIVYPPHINSKLQQDRKRNTARAYSGFEKNL